MSFYINYFKNNYFNFILFLNIIFCIIPGYVYVSLIVSLFLLITFILIEFFDEGMQFISEHFFIFLIIFYIILNFFINNYDFIINSINQGFIYNKFDILKIYSETSVAVKVIHLLLLLIFLKITSFNYSEFRKYLKLLNVLCIFSLIICLFIIYFSSYIRHIYFDSFISYKDFLREYFNMHVYADAKVYYALLGGNNSASYITLITIFFNLYFFKINLKTIVYNSLLLIFVLLIYRSRTTIYLLYLFCFYSIFVKHLRISSLIFLFLTIYVTNLPLANYKIFNPERKTDDISNINLSSVENADSYRNYGVMKNVFSDLNEDVSSYISTLITNKGYLTVQKTIDVKSNENNNNNNNNKFNDIFNSIDFEFLQYAVNQIDNLNQEEKNNFDLEQKKLKNLKLLIKDDYTKYIDKKYYEILIKLIQTLEVIEYEEYIRDQYQIKEYNFYLAAATSGRYLFYLEIYENMKNINTFHKIFGNSNVNFEYYYMDRNINHANYDLHSLFLNVLWKWGIFGLTVLLSIIFYSLFKIIKTIIISKGSLKTRYFSLLFLGSSLIFYAAIHTSIFASNLFWFYGILIYVLIFPNVFFSKK